MITESSDSDSPEKRDFFYRLSFLLAQALSTRDLLVGLEPLLQDWGVEGFWLGAARTDGSILFEHASDEDMAAYVANVPLRWDDSPWARGPGGRAVQTGTPQYVADWKDGSAPGPWSPWIEQFGWRSSAALPLRVGDRTQLLSLYSRVPGMFGRQHTQAQLEEFANLLATALSREAAVAAERRHLARQALRDPLTGLPNRTALDQHIEEALARANRNERLLAVGLLDLDDFKPVNDRFGHAVGDQVLSAVAQRLKAAVRESDFVARLGGDEFVILMEDIEDLDDFEMTLERIRQSITVPIALDEVGEVQVGASLGVVIYPLCIDCTEQASGILLRAADQALYRVKSSKGLRDRWWGMFDARRPFDPGTDGSEQLLGDTDGQPGYGPDACRLLEPLHASLESLVSSFVERFFDEQLAGSSGAGQVLASLTPDNREGLQQALANHFRLLIDPHLDAATHHATAARVGRVHAMAGIEPTWLIDAYSQWTNMVQSRLVHAGLAHAVLSHRVGMDLQAQLSGFETIEEGRQDVLRRLDALAWRAQSFADLAQGVVDALAGLDEVVAATIGRPGEGPQFQFEFVAGDTFKAYLDEVSAGKARTIVTDPSHPQGQGPTGRAWRSGQIERTVNYASDPRMEPWRSTAARLGVRSNVAIPLAPPEGVAHVVLTLYSSYAGGFSSRAHKAMLRHLRHVLGLALLRLDPKAEAAAPLPYQIRRQWRSLLEDGGLIMYYQPVIDLRTGRPVSMESLARLRDGTGELILPDRFLPTFTNEDMRRLFDLGLNQALRHLLEWDREGLELKVSLNLPSQGLMDSRYIGLVEHALARTSLAPDRLLLEVLESGEIEDEQARDRAIAGFKALGVQLAEDDLGSGHSSLLRLDQLPFDWVKIDQALVRRGPDDALRTLVFIRHLTRLAEDMGKVVVVEGLENQGLVEAAAMLGAGHGQGHAISPPMPPQEVPGWVGGFQLSLEPMQPATALGTLASYMLFNEQITASIRDPDALERLLEMPCPAMHYIEAVGLAGQPLERAHRNLTALARRGLERREFVRARNKLVNLLIDRIRLEA